MLKFAVNPFLYVHLVMLLLFPNVVKARKRTAILRRRGKLHFLGYAHFESDGGRPPDVHGRKRFKSDQLDHDVTVTGLILPHFMQGAEIERGFNLPFRSDALMRKNGRTFHVEYDSGKKGNRVSVDRLLKTYPNNPTFTEFVLLVTSSTERKKNLLGKLKALSHCLLATTLTEAMNTPYGAIWEATDGTFVQI